MARLTQAQILARASAHTGIARGVRVRVNDNAPAWAGTVGTVVWVYLFHDVPMATVRTDDNRPAMATFDNLTIISQEEQ